LTGIPERTGESELKKMMKEKKTLDLPFIYQTTFNTK
jgi:hypothetical protein